MKKDVEIKQYVYAWITIFLGLILFLVVFYYFFHIKEINNTQYKILTKIENTIKYKKKNLNTTIYFDKPIISVGRYQHITPLPYPNEIKKLNLIQKWIDELKEDNVVTKLEFENFKKKLIKNLYKEHTKKYTEYKKLKIKYIKN